MKLLLFLIFCWGADAVPMLAQKGKPKLPKTAYHYLSNTKNPEEINAISNKLERFFYSFTGHFHNNKQADTSSSPLFKHQELVMIPIWTKQRVGEYWILMSWYRKDMVEAPLGHQIFKISKLNRDTFIMERYDFPEELLDKIGNSWAQENPFAQLKPQDLIKTSCVYHIVPNDKSEFRVCLLNDVTTCPTGSNVARSSGAYKYSGYDIYVNPNGIILYSSGYDDQKKEVVTYKPIGNYFERIPKDQPKYMDILYSDTKSKKNK